MAFFIHTRWYDFLRTYQHLRWWYGILAGIVDFGTNLKVPIHISLFFLMFSAEFSLLISSLIELLIELFNPNFVYRIIQCWFWLAGMKLKNQAGNWYIFQEYWYIFRQKPWYWYIS